MKILFINTVFGKSSTGRIVLDLCNLLEQNNDEWCAIYGRYRTKYRNAYYISNKLDLFFHILISKVFDRHGFGSWLATKKAISIIKKEKPDLIHIHNLHGYYINIKELFHYLKMTNIPVVWTLHDCWPFTGHCVYYDYVGCNKWKTECYKCPKKKIYPDSICFDSSRNNYKKKKEIFNTINNLTIVTVSDWLKKQVEDSFLKRHKIIRIYNGIDRTIFKPTVSSIRKKLDIENKYVILGVSDVWSERKGLSLFLELSKCLHKDEIIIMIGFKNKSEINNLPKNIIGINRTDNVQQLVEYYSTANVLLNPSYEETFGLITAEALCCGTPVIVQNRTACPELVDDTCGDILSGDTVDEIRESLDKIRKKNLNSESCLKRSDLFDKTKNYQLYLKLYKEVFEENNYGKKS